jgi:hypothetical protein
MILVRFGKTNQNLPYFDQSVAYVTLTVSLTLTLTLNTLTRTLTLTLTITLTAANNGGKKAKV